MGRGPTVGAIIPTIGRDSLIETLRSACTQDFDSVVVVADAQRSRVREMARAFPVTVIETPGQTGAANAVNVGVSATRSDYICVIADDDAWLPGAGARFRSAAQQLHALAVPGVAVGDVLLEFPGGRREARLGFGADLRSTVSSLYERSLPLPAHRDPHFAASVVHRSLLLEHPLPGISVREDIAWWIEVARSGIEGLRIPAFQAVVRRDPSRSNLRDSSELQVEFARRFLGSSSEAAAKFLLVSGSKGLALVGDFKGVRMNRNFVRSQLGVNVGSRSIAAFTTSLALEGLARIVAERRRPLSPP